MGCMVNPPVEGDESYTTYMTEKNNILDSLKRRATKLSEALDKLEGVSCNQASGAMYCFPNVVLPKGAHDAAEKNGKTADEIYCMELLENTGIVTVPGKGFGQAEGTLHIRFTILPPEKDMDMIVERITKFHENFLKKYA
jgi:alanine transaminase